jgi:hypothetical protein
MVARDRVAFVLPKAADNVEKWYQDLFCRLVTQTTLVESLEGFTLPGPSALPDDIRSAYGQFMNLDGHLLDAWYTALETVDRAPGAADFWPAARLAEADLKNSLAAVVSGGEINDSSS